MSALFKNKKITVVIFVTTVISLLSPIQGIAQNHDEEWAKLLIEFGRDCNYWGYNMNNQSEIPSQEYWKNSNWEKVKMFEYRVGSNYEGQDLGSWAYDAIPYATKIDDTHILIHNLFRNFQGLFKIDPSVDLTIEGEVDFDNKTITIQPQEYADGYYFAGAQKDGDNYYTLDELTPVTLTFKLRSTRTTIQTDGMVGSVSNAFAFYKNNDTDNHYSAGIGMCGFSIDGKTNIVSYILNPTIKTVLPSNNPITEIHSVDLKFDCPLYENPNITESITIEKDGDKLEVPVTGYISRDDSYHYIIEPETPLKKVGEYTFTIPKGLLGDINYNRNNYTNGEANPELKLKFTLVDAAQLNYDFNYIEVDPATESTLDRLSEIKLTFPSAVSINESLLSELAGGNLDVAVSESNPNVVVVTLDREQVNGGEYSLNFPQGLFGDAKYGEGFTIGHANPSFTLNYTISGKYQMFFDLSYSAITPEPMKTYDEVSEIKLTFDEPVVVNEEIAARAAMYKNSGQVVDAFKSIAVSPDDDKTVVITFNKTLAEAGLYWIYIKEGTIGDATYGIDFTYGHANKEYQLGAYTITGNSGVNSIQTDNIDCKTRYLNLQGLEVSEDNLIPGIYIQIKGNTAKKIYVK